MSTTERAPALGLTYVATVSFLASRLAPSGGFFVALAGGVAVARTAMRRGAREGYGATFAAMLESIAIMGPARAGVPFTQALSAPIIGRLEARGAPAIAEILACAAIRVLHNAATSAFFIWVIVGLDAYTGSYDALLARLPFVPEGTDWALITTAIGLVAWGAFASTVQVLVYRRGLRRWPDDLDDDAGDATTPSAHQPAAPYERRFDPRAVVLAGALALAVLLATTAWIVLAAVTAWLAVAWLVSRPDWDPVPTGAALAAILGVTVLIASLVGSIGVDEAVRRAMRVVLLVLVATWMRAAAGSPGMREVMRRALHKLRAIPSIPEAARKLERLASERRLLAAGRALLDAVGPVEKKAVPVMDAVLGWVHEEAGRFEPEPPPPPLRLRARAVDGVLVLLALAPAAALPLV